LRTHESQEENKEKTKKNREKTINYISGTITRTTTKKDEQQRRRRDYEMLVCDHCWCGDWIPHRLSLSTTHHTIPKLSV
jgi:hypothetical protein